MVEAGVKRSREEMTNAGGGGGGESEKGRKGAVSSSTALSSCTTKSGSSKSGSRRQLRNALARYARIGQSALGCFERAQVLLKRVEAQSSSVALVLASLPGMAMLEPSAPRGEGFGPIVANALADAKRRAMGSAGGASAGPGGGQRPLASELALRFDDEGRAVDGRGNVLERTGQYKSLKVNEKLESSKAPKKLNPYASWTRLDSADVDDVSDPRLNLKNRDSKKDRAFNFIKEGHYVKLGEATRAKELGARLFTVNRPEVVGGDDAGADAAADDDDDVSVGGGAGDEPVRRLPPRSEHYASIPGMEWWDEEFLDRPLREKRAASIAERMKTEYDKCKLEHSRFHGLVHHPASTRPLGGEEKQVANMPFYLTTKDRKRVRRQTRAEREREKQDKIQLGLVAPPEPKFKLSNFMKVLGEQAVADPSKMERKVMEQVNQRLSKHEMRNAARKLTPQEKKEKKRRKLAEDTNSGVTVAVFYVRSLESSQHRFKIDVNANQLSLTGGVLICSAPDAAFALVIVEGGPKAIKRFVGLMTRRIDWADNASLQTHTNALDGKNWSKQVWQGIVVKRNFTAFRFQECKSTLTARRVLDSKQVAHYWDMVVQAHEAGPPKVDDDDDDQDDE